MYALFGLMYFRGLLGLNNHRYNILFSEKAGPAVFGATMSRDTFKFLISNIMFDDKNEREMNWPHDRFAAARVLFMMFNNNCTKYIIPSEYLAIDETLYPMRHQIAFRQYNPNKPAKYGLLFKSINDARFPFTYQATVYAGKPESGNGPYYIDKTENYIKYLVTQIEKDISLQGRNISMDRLYTSISIAEWLLEKKITVVGTLQTNRIEIPDKLKSTRDREDLSSTIYWEKEKKDMVMCTYTVKTKSKGWKNVLMLSTMHPLLGITRDDDKKKTCVVQVVRFHQGRN